MAIDRIPGVGPANSDIATAVAGSVPTIGAITTAITTNAASSGLTAASIATAVAAPSAATIAAAVAAPSAATIAAAVAAPSAATIATAVAGAVPTLAQINTSVSTNASPYGGTWTTVATVNAPNTTSWTISGLGSYKHLQIHFSQVGFGAQDTLFLRFNGDSGNNYYGHAHGVNGGAVTNQTSSFRISQSNPTYLRLNTMFEIAGSNSTTSIKSGNGPWFSDPTGSGSVGHMAITWANTAAITSMTIFTTGSALIDVGTILIRGAN